MGGRAGFFISPLQPAGLFDGERAGLQPLLTSVGDCVPFEYSDIVTKYRQGWQEDNAGSVSPELSVNSL